MFVYRYIMIYILLLTTVSEPFFSPGERILLHAAHLQYWNIYSHRIHSIEHVYTVCLTVFNSV